MSHDFDAIIIGAGPGGSTAALVLAREGFRVGLFEKARHPRFHIGESILPRNMGLIRELGLEDELAKIPQVPKYGAEFGIGNDFKTMEFSFTEGLLTGSPIFNIERAPFDAMLAEQAKKAGATLIEDTAIKSIVKLSEGDVAVSTGDRTYTAKILLDASGHGTVVGRHLGTRKNFTDPILQKVAYFQHFENVERPPGDKSGYPSLFMCKEGWLWFIGLNETKTSVGFVTRPDLVKDIDVHPTKLLRWAIARCPVARHRMRDATGPEENIVLSDFSYTCKPFAGPGYFMVGDAGCFLDPIFSTGVTLAMVGAVEAAQLASGILKGTQNSAKAYKSYNKFVAGSTAPFWTMIRNYYHHSFRELFMNKTGPLQVHKAMISLLAGCVFPKPPWALQWRLWFFMLCVRVQKVFALVPRRAEHSLIDETPVEIPIVPGEAVGAA